MSCKEENKKQATEKLQQLVNGNFENSIKVEISYESCASKTDNSLLIENK